MGNKYSNRYVPNHLFAEPSFIEGLGSVLDIGGTMHKKYNISSSDVLADIKALKNDWNAIGEDMTNSISQHERGQK